MGEQIMSDAQIEKQVEEQTVNISGLAVACKVTDVETYSAAGSLVKTIKEARKKIVEYFQPMKSAAQKAHKEVCTREKEHLSPLDEAEKLVRNTISIYLNEQERIRQEEERKVRLKAEDDARKEREKLARQAEKAAAKGKDEKAEALREQAEEVVATPVFVAPVVEKTTRTEGVTISQRKETVVEVTDIRKLLAYIAATEVAPIGAVEIKLPVLKRWVKDNQIKNGQSMGLSITEKMVSNIR
jgi:hypothetical protein